MATPEARPAEVIATPPSRFVTWMGNAKRFSDLGIALPVLLYASGFVVLGCYSEANNLGLQAFPTIQFFSAGAGFLLIFGSIVLLALALRQLLTSWFKWLQSGTKVSKFVGKATQAVTFGSIAVYIISGWLHMDKVNLAAMMTLTVSFFFSAEGWIQNLARYYIYFIALFICLASLTWYAFNAYPAIPASFGGGKPRHAHIQVDTKSMSNELSQQVFGPGTASPTGVRELEADVYLITDNSILIKVPRAESADKGSDSRKASEPRAVILQLRRSDVSAIFWESPH